MAVEIRVDMKVHTRPRAPGSVFDRWGRHVPARGVVLTPPVASTGGDVVSVRLEDGSVLPYGVDDIEPDPAGSTWTGPRHAGDAAALSRATDADIAREFFRRFTPVKVMVSGPSRAAGMVDHDGERWISGVPTVYPSAEAHAAGEDGFVAALERAMALAKGGA